MTDTRILWPFEVDWSSSYRVTYTYRTDILTRRSGSEQRRALRQTPRKTIEHLALLPNADALRAFNRLLDGGQNMSVVMPEVTRKAQVAVASAGGASVLTIEGAAPAWLAAGAEVVLRARGGCKVAVVDEVDGDEVSFTSAVGAWPAGTAIHPALTGTLPDELKAQRLTNGVAQVTVRFDVDPGSESYPETEAPLTLGGDEVFPFTPNWATPLDATHIWPVERIDYGSGRIATHRPIDFPSRGASGVYLARSAAEAEAMVAFFVRARGQRGSFLNSTLEHDLPPAAALASDTATLLVAGDDCFNAYHEHPVFGAVALAMAGGSVIRRIVTGMTLVEGDTAIAVNANWGQDVSIDTVDAISWLPRSRLASDEMTIEWLTDEVAQVQMSTRSLPMDAGVNFVALRVTPEGDDRETLPGDDRVVLYFGGDA